MNEDCTTWTLTFKRSTTTSNILILNIRRTHALCSDFLCSSPTLSVNSFLLLPPTLHYFHSPSKIVPQTKSCHPCRRKMQVSQKLRQRTWLGLTLHGSGNSHDSGRSYSCHFETSMSDNDSLTRPVEQVIIVSLKLSEPSNLAASFCESCNNSKETLWTARSRSMEVANCQKEVRAFGH